MWRATQQAEPPPKRQKAAPSAIDAVRAGDAIFIGEDKLLRVVVACLEKSGVAAEHAPLVAEVLVAADRRGIPSHGVNRLELYCKELQAGLIDGRATPVLMPGCDGPSTAVVDGRNALGAVVCRFAMGICIAKAKATGVGMVTCARSNHFGIAAHWAHMAMREGLMGMSFTNTAPFMVPTRGSARAGGTNPICCCCPAEGGDSFELDMATSAVAVGKVEVQHRKHAPVPMGWGVDRHGKPCEDTTEILGPGGLCPLGGDEAASGYKGYGLMMFVEILCAVLSGAATGPAVQPWKVDRANPSDYGHCFLCIDPGRFAPGFEGRLAKYLTAMRTQPRADAALPVLVPGDPEKAEYAESARRGVRLNKNVAASVRCLADSLGIDAPGEL